MGNRVYRRCVTVQEGFTLHPTPYTLHPTPYTLMQEVSTDRAAKLHRGKGCAKMATQQLDHVYHFEDGEKDR
jgi:hypothetical protein